MTAIPAEAPARPPMRGREFAGLAGEITATCQRYGVEAGSPMSVHPRGNPTSSSASSMPFPIEA